MASISLRGWKGVAAPGGVSLTRRPMEHVRDKLRHQFVDLGEKAIKNIARPIGVYALKPNSETRAHPLLRRTQ